MFFNPASTRSTLANNENATVLRSKYNGEHGTQKAASHENNVKTPYPNKSKDGASSKSGQTSQRRRRAFGDISNRKAIGAAGGGKGGALPKQKAPNNATQGLLKPGNSKVIIPSSSTKNRTAQVKFVKTPSTKSVAANNSRHGFGGGSRLKSAGPKRELHTSLTDYDGAFGVTTRWSKDDIAEESRLLFDLVSEDELNLVSNLRDEMMDRRSKESCETDRLELERGEEQLLEQIREVREVNVEEMGTMLATCSICREEDEKLDLLNENLPWEEDDDFSEASPGLDPDSLWGDM